MSELHGDVFGHVIQAGKIGSVQVGAKSHQALHGLPRASPTFTGRTAELASLAGAPLSVVSGLPGVGKTELVLHFARQHSFPGGVLHVELHGYDPDRRWTSERALESFLWVLGVRETPPGEAEKAALYRSLLAEREPMLVVLDDASSVEQVTPLLPAGHQVIVTSRHKLTGLTGARHVELDVLDVDSSVALVGSTELASLCGHLPLALQIMAALRETEPERPDADWADELREAQFDLLDGLQATFALSYNALSVEQQRLFRLLALHPGDGFTVECAAMLTYTPFPQTRKTLRALRTAHLLEPGYRFHDLVRLYAKDRLAEEPDTEREAALDRLMVYFTGRSAKADQEFREQNTPAALEWLDDNRATLISAAGLAHATGRHKDVLWLAHCLYFLLRIRSSTSAWLEISELAESSARELGAEDAELEALNEQGAALATAGQLREAHDLLLRTAQRALELGMHEAVLRAMSTVSRVLLLGGHTDDAIMVLHSALAEAEKLHDDQASYVLLGNLGAVLLHQKRFTEAIECLEESLRRDEDGSYHAISTRNQLGIACLGTGRLQQALLHLETGLATCREFGDIAAEARLRLNLGRVLFALGRHAAAEQAWTASLDGMRAVETPDNIAEAEELVEQFRVGR
ncbi:tetratricopeptide repeat protein [Lentzea tibetensis]|uniref:Tetratricopeptide repeat protein n=1 Tax=Lentzea tibetensis TaxID=2591470 RepID=A0A563EW88_9PSEU|nr:tetratricopeptide repeat protein [Lentzea tibetensis]TWP51842.1 tetratricopeptide repeat protein [Lentzea tibetensis]